MNLARSSLVVSSTSWELVVKRQYKWSSRQGRWRALDTHRPQRVLSAIPSIAEMADLAGSLSPSLGLLFCNLEKCFENVWNR